MPVGAGNAKYVTRRIYALGQVPGGDMDTGGLLLIAPVLAVVLFVSVRSSKRKAIAEASNREEDRLKLEQLRNGQELMVYSPVRVMLKSGESAHAGVFASLHEDKTIGYKGASSGASIRIARGVSVRSGRMRGTAVKRDIVTSSGELVVTNRRLVFAGDKKSISIDLSKLVQAVSDESTILVSDNSKTHLFSTEPGFGFEAFKVTLDKVIKQP